MSEEDPLFGWATARNTDPDTSQEAADSVRGPIANAMEKKVLDAIRDNGGEAHADIIVDLSGQNWNTITPRIAPLRRKNFIKDSGKREVGRSGRKQIVWELIK